MNIQYQIDKFLKFLIHFHHFYLLINNLSYHLIRASSSSPNTSAHPKCLNFVFAHPNFFAPNYKDYVFTLIILPISHYKLYTPRYSFRAPSSCNFRCALPTRMKPCTLGARGAPRLCLIPRTLQMYFSKLTHLCASRTQMKACI